MRTSLTFEAPADLSVGRVTVENGSGVLKEWVATPNQKAFSLDDVQPGFYTAEVAPAGLRPRSYVFEVKSEIANTVTMPLYAVLAAGGGDAAFSGVEDIQVAIEGLERGRPLPSQDDASRSESFAAISGWAESSFHSAIVAPSRVLTIGLSQDEDLSAIGGWTPYLEGEPAVELESGAVTLLIAASSDALRRHPRLRLSAALEGVRIERMMMPVFLGGTRVAFRASPLIAADIAIEVTPRDPERRALLRALQAGVEEEAAAVYEDVLRGGSIARFVSGPEEDAWAAIVAALLTIRFPEVFGSKPLDWGPQLAERYPWASDTHIILARHHLASVPSHGDRSNAARAALEALHIAQRLGAPYFAASNQLMGEMLGGLAGLKGFDDTLTDQAQNQLNKWRGDVPLQRSAGAIFSWLSADKRLLAQGQVAPYQGTGELADRYTRILFRGRVGPSGISVLAANADTPPPKAAALQEVDLAPTSAAEIDVSGTGLATPTRRDAPALGRPIIAPDDANKGRFGGKCAVRGHSLSATFTETPGARWVDIHLLVQAERSLAPSYSDAVELFLHPSFNPSRLRVPFRGHEATVTVRAVGGFTVGAWLPEREIELECDLALLPDAPSVVRDL
jgi:hypothetical protein